ncbi:MAG: PTS sugar transporter subunit IIA [Burkholderiales bacterium]|nr:PTS sugar transporter subunit IIA [Burkholderiales bacterium]
MNLVAQIIGADGAMLDVDAGDKDAVLDRLAQLLARRSGVPEAQVRDGLASRERLGSTGLGHGVAIPHARMPQCAAVAGVLVRTRVPVAFDAPDGRPVSLFLALLVPKQATERHLKLLATAAAMFGDKPLREALRAAQDANEAARVLASWADGSAAQTPR